MLNSGRKIVELQTSSGDHGRRYFLKILSLLFDYSGHSGVILNPLCAVERITLIGT